MKLINHILKDIFSDRLSYKERYKLKEPYYNRFIKIIYLLYNSKTIYLQVYQKIYYKVSFYNYINKIRNKC